METWKLIDGSDGYEISDLGSVRSIGRVVQTQAGPRHYQGKTLRIRINENGYPRVWIRRGGRPVFVYVHDLICAAFIGPKPIGMEVAHGDGVRSRSVLSNLAYKTPKENQADRIEHNTRMVGGDHPMAILDKERVLQIKERLKQGERQKDIAQSFGVSRATISAIATGRTWADAANDSPPVFYGRAA